MAILSALAAISAIAFQGGTLTLGGKVVQINYPTPAVRQVPEEVKNWDGFGGLPVGQREWPTPFQAPGDWSSIAAKLAELGPVAKDAPSWKTKVFILTQTDKAISDPSGLYWQKRSRLSSQQVDDLLRAIARVPGYARAATNGALNVSLDVVVDGEPLIFEPETASVGNLATNSPNQAWHADYLLARTNRGAYVAEDKVFRGPYQSVLLLTADLLENALSKEPDGYGFDGMIVDSIATQATLNWMSLGLPGITANGSLGKQFSSAVWQTLQSTDEPAFNKLSELYASPSAGSSDSDLKFPLREASFSGNVTPLIATDDQRGSVLRYSETSPVRAGGFALPYRNIDIGKTPFLTFWVKSSSKDALAINLGDGSRSTAIPVERDGAWHQVTLDLRSLASGTIDSLYLGPSRAEGERNQVGGILYFFDDFQLASEGTATGMPTFENVELGRRAEAAKALSATDLAKDASDFVKLNGLLGRTTPYAATDEEALILLTKNVNVRIAGEATKRLAQLGTPTAKAEMVRLVTSSPFENVKQIAAIEVGKMGDAKLAGLLSRQFASRFWQTRMAGAKAVTMLPGDEAAVISMTFLQENDPQVRLNLTRSANVQNSVVQKRFLWSTVNDPSDSVRAESAWRLITSGKENLAAEGYKAIRDDSNWVRIDLLNRMALSAAEAHRATLRLAITDLSPRVRAATLAALAKQPGAVSLDEIANVLQDKFPVVQLALIELVKSKKLSLPAESLTNLRASIDPRVVEKVKELGQ